MLCIEVFFSSNMGKSTNRYLEYSTTIVFKYVFEKHGKHLNMYSIYMNLDITSLLNTITY